MADAIYGGHFDEQPAALARAVASLAEVERTVEGLGLERGTRVLYTGSGTSRYAGEVAVAVATALGVRAACAPSLPFLQAVDRLGLGADTLVVAVSQSGGTRTLAEALRRARHHGSPTLAVTAEAGSLLAAVADGVVASHTGPETIYAKTKGFLTTAAAASAVALALARLGPGPHPEVDAARAAMEGLPGAVGAAIERSRAGVPAAAERLSACSSLIVVGGGSQWPAAREGALKILEVAKLVVASFELEESLHGVFNAIGPDTGVVLVAGRDSDAARLDAFARAVLAVNAPLVVAAAPEVAVDLERHVPVDVRLPAVPSAPFEPFVGVVPLQLLAWQLAGLRGADAAATRYPELYAVFRTKEGQA